MTFTFDPELTSAKDRLRFMVGDTGKASTTEGDLTIANAMLPDETYTAALALSGGDESQAAISVARNLVGRYAQMPDKVTIGPDTFDYGSRIKALQQLIRDLAPDSQADEKRSKAKLRQLEPSYT